MDGIRLSGLNVGKEGVILSVDLEQEQKKRLTELGFVPGSRIRVLHKAPGGSPVAYSIKGTVVALRNHDCTGITVFANDH